MQFADLEISTSLHDHVENPHLYFFLNPPKEWQVIEKGIYVYPVECLSYEMLDKSNDIISGGSHYRGPMESIF